MAKNSKKDDGHNRIQKLFPEQTMILAICNDNNNIISKQFQINFYYVIFTMITDRINQLQ